MKLALLAAVAALCTGCASLSDGPHQSGAFTAEEIAFHTLNGVDAAQSINAISHDCYREVAPVTRDLLGDKPEPGAYVAYGVAVSLLFNAAQVWMTDHDVKPWIRHTVNLTALVVKGYAVAHNASIGMHVSGPNEACE